MPRGGARPGAGRPKGSGRKQAQREKFPRDIVEPAVRAGMTPIDYMLAVMRDDEADPMRRDRMAVAAAPYIHAKAEASAPGKKEQAEQAAKTAERGTSWDGLLQ